MKPLYLHIGVHKTGTTSIQQSMFKNRTKLPKFGCAYFGYAKNHSAPLFWLFSKEPEKYHITLKRRLSADELANERRLIDNSLRDFLQENPETKKIISGEDVSSLREEEVAALKACVERYGKCPIKVIVYLRNYYEFLDSTVQELVKNGRPLHDVERALRQKQSAPIPDYEFKLQKFINLFGRENLEIRLFNPPGFKGGDLIADFCDAIGTPEMFPALKNFRANSSISAESVAALDQYNQLFPLLIGDERNQARTEKAQQYLGSSDGRKFRVAAPDLLRSYEELIAPDVDYLSELLPAEEVNFLTAPRDRPPNTANNDLDIDFVFHRITEALLDLESYENGFRAILDLTTFDEESEDDFNARSLSKYLRFINDESLCRRLGRVFQLRDELDLATACVRRAVELDPNDIDHYMVLGNLNVTHTDWREAERAYRKACELDGNNAPAHRRLAVCCEKLKLLSDAKAAAAKAVALAPQNEEFHRYLERVEKLEAAASASEPA